MLVLHFQQIGSGIHKAVVIQSVDVMDLIAQRVFTLGIRKIRRITQTGVFVPRFDQVVVVHLVHAVFADLHLFSKQVHSAVFAVVVQIHVFAVRGFLKAHFQRQIQRDAVSQHGCVAHFSQQHPRACGLAHIQEIRPVFQLELIGFLGVTPCAVAASAQLAQTTCVADRAIGRNEGHGAGGLGFVFGAAIDVCAALIDRIIAEKKQRVHMGRLHDGKIALVRKHRGIGKGGQEEPLFAFDLRGMHGHFRAVYRQHKALGTGIRRAQEHRKQYKNQTEPFQGEHLLFVIPGHQ